MYPECPTCPWLVQPYLCTPKPTCCTCKQNKKHTVTSGVRVGHCVPIFSRAALRDLECVLYKGLYTHRAYIPSARTCQNLKELLFACSTSKSGIHETTWAPPERSVSKWVKVQTVWNQRLFALTFFLVQFPAPGVKKLLSQDLLLPTLHIHAVYWNHYFTVNTCVHADSHTHLFVFR